MAARSTNPVFDYRALRLLVGLIAFAIPFVTSLISSTVITSYSIHYTKLYDLYERAGFRTVRGVPMGDNDAMHSENGSFYIMRMALQGCGMA